jgi:hypothetical protein
MINYGCFGMALVGVLILGLAWSIHPSEYGEVLFALGVGTTIISLAARPFLIRAQLRTALDHKGLFATAVIRHMEDTKRTVNEDPVFRLELDVTHPETGLYQAAIDQIVPRTKLGELRIGAELRVSIHPEDPAKLMVDW